MMFNNRHIIFSCIQRRTNTRIAQLIACITQQSIARHTHTHKRARTHAAISVCTLIDSVCSCDTHDWVILRHIVRSQCKQQIILNLCRTLICWRCVRTSRPSAIILCFRHFRSFFPDWMNDVFVCVCGGELATLIKNHNNKQQQHQRISESRQTLRQTRVRARIDGPLYVFNYFSVNSTSSSGDLFVTPPSDSVHKCRL